MTEELARHRCIDRDGTLLFVIERCHVFITQGGTETRRHRGAGRAALLDGEPVRYVDGNTFQIVATGEILTHDLARCDCAPAAKISTFAGVAAAA